MDLPLQMKLATLKNIRRANESVSEAQEINHAFDEQHNKNNNNKNSRNGNGNGNGRSSGNNSALLTSTPILVS